MLIKIKKLLFVKKVVVFYVKLFNYLQLKANIYCSKDEEEDNASIDEDSLDDSSSEDDRELSKEIRKTHKLVNRERRQKEWEEQRQREENGEEEESNERQQPKFYELKAGEEYAGISTNKKNRINK